MKLPETINGALLSDASIRVRDNKYHYFALNAKDKRFLEWVRKILKRFGIHNTYIVLNSKLTNVFTLGFYMNKCSSKELLLLRENWYRKINGKTVKVVPKNFKLTPTTLLFWHLGDGSLIRRKNDPNRVPFIVLATNCFLKEDIDFLIQKLKELNLNFYPVKYKSGFTGKDCGYCLYSNTQDGTPFRFFKLIGFKCPKEIADCFTGRKGRYSELHYFKGKWPTEEDLIKILSNIDVSKILKHKRKESGLTQNQLAERIGTCREHVRDIENGRRYASVKIFRKVLKALNIEIKYLLNELNFNNLSKIGG